MTVGIFGAWRAVEGDPIYSRAVDYGRALGAAGYRVLTGGYSGVMEAANRGAAEAGAETIGVTCPELDKLLPVNCWVSTELKGRDIQDRLAICFRTIHAAIFFPGRSGTGSEIAFALELREKGILAYPVFLTCQFWNDFLAAHAATGLRLPYPASVPALTPTFVQCGQPDELLSRLEASA